MNNLETLKKELIAQKEQIEKMSGVVRVAGSNPSPSEITAGIKTIPSTDLSMATATEEDVLQGKTFFAGNAIIKTGTANIDPDAINHIFMSNYSTITTSENVYYSCPQGLKTIRSYLFYNNYNPIHFTFNNSLTEIEDYAFTSAKNMVFYNFENLSALKKIGASAFANCKGESLSFEFNDVLQRISSNGFYNALFNGATIKLTKKLTYFGTYAFYQEQHRSLCALNVDECVLTSLASYGFYNVAFVSDFNVPATVTTINDNFNYNGCFSSIHFPTKVTNIKTGSFGGYESDPLSKYYLNSVVFDAETPPTFGTKVFAIQNVTNGFKIYVPDNAVDAYKAVSNLSWYVDCIYPMSQKE